MREILTKFRTSHNNDTESCSESYFYILTINYSYKAFDWLICETSQQWQTEWYKKLIMGILLDFADIYMRLILFTLYMKRKSNHLGLEKVQNGYHYLMPLVRFWSFVETFLSNEQVRITLAYLWHCDKNNGHQRKDIKCVSGNVYGLYLYGLAWW